MKKCKKCGKGFEPIKGLVNYCSLECRNSRSWSEEDKKKKSISAKNSKKVLSANRDKDKINKQWETRRLNGGGKLLKKEMICTYCCETFISERTPSGENFRTWCSSECYINIKRKNFKGKNVTYKNVKMDSKWEKKLAIFLDDKNIKWERPEYIIWLDNDGVERKYFPDFYLPEYDVYLDPKNPLLMETQKEKLEIIESKVTLIYGDLDYVMHKVRGLIV